MQTSDNQKFRNEYRIPSTRLRGWDYSQDGAYFVTICTKNREHFFGEIANDNMRLSEMGKIIADEWNKTAKIRDNVELGEWVVMPNHFHAVVIIYDNTMVETPRCMVETPRRGVSTGNHNPNHKSQWKSGCLGAIINQFKSKCTKRIHEIFPDFAWQSRFHDHIIRNENEYNKISEYIINNPINWEQDKNFKQENV